MAVRSCNNKGGCLDNIRIVQIFRKLTSQLRQESGNEPIPGAQTDSRAKTRGSLRLFGARAGLYFDAFEEICKAAAPLTIWNRESLDDLICNTLSQTLAAPDDKTVREHVDAFASQLKAEPKSFHVSMAVFGLSVDCRGVSFGEVTFSTQHIKAKEWNADQPAVMKGEVLFVSIDVTAINEEAAQELAARIIDRHLAILNAICSDYPPSKVRISRSPESDSDYSMCKIACEGEEQTKLGNKVRIWPVQRSRLLEIYEKHGGKLLSELLIQDTSMALRITSAFETAGTACVESNPHISFLLFAIALESAVLGKEREELTLQLAVRTAHLLSAGMEGRRQTYDRVKRLYATRSKVVHTGSKNVTLQEVAEIKYICLSALYSLLSYDRVSSFKEERDLNQWFIDQLLDSETIIQR